MMTANKGTTRSLGRPDDHLSKGGVEIDVVQLGDIKVKRASYPPGWRFSERMGAPICYDTHVGYALTGASPWSCATVRRCGSSPATPS